MQVRKYHQTPSLENIGQTIKDASQDFSKHITLQHEEKGHFFQGFNAKLRQTFSFRLAKIKRLSRNIFPSKI